MLTYELISFDGVVRIYRYYPEDDKEKYGEFRFYPDSLISNENPLQTIGSLSDRYWVHTLSVFISDYRRKGYLPEKGMTAWY